MGPCIRRDPEATRTALLQAACEEIHTHGFQAASLDRILARAHVTKGALYHHFGSKTELGYAVVEEMLAPGVKEFWQSFMGNGDDPIGHLIEALRTRVRAMPRHELELGCPVNNLMQEMSNTDEGFRQRLAGIIDGWAESIAEGLRRGQRAGTVREDVDPRRTADFLIAVIEGTAGTAKNAQRFEIVESNLTMLAQYLETLRPASATI